MNNHTNILDNLEEMEKFLETYKLPRINHKETENLKRMIISNKIESVTTDSPNNRSP